MNLMDLSVHNIIM